MINNFLDQFNNNQKQKEKKCKKKQIQIKDLSQINKLYNKFLNLLIFLHRIKIKINSDKKQLSKYIEIQPKFPI